MDLNTLKVGDFIEISQKDNIFRITGVYQELNWVLHDFVALSGKEYRKYDLSNVAGNIVVLKDFKLNKPRNLPHRLTKIFA